MKTAMTIAGSDSGGTSAITAITAQNTIGVTAVLPLPADIVTAQIEAIAGDIGADAVKTGMLANAAIVEAVAAAIDTLELPRVVVDPVMIAKSGDRLLEEEAVAAIKAELLRRAYVVTPNVREAEVLAGMRVDAPGAAREAARRIRALGPTAVVLKGGHLDGPETVDLLFDGREFIEFRGPRIETRNDHGTGCTFAAAIAANLALGQPLREAVGHAKHYVARAIRHGLAIGRGHGPLDHFCDGITRT
jgi:hydroxymethylpyrimidine/phosphomethylpyrimidine kinase